MLALSHPTVEQHARFLRCLELLPTSLHRFVSGLEVVTCLGNAGDLTMEGASIIVNCVMVVAQIAISAVTRTLV